MTTSPAPTPGAPGATARPGWRRVGGIAEWFNFTPQTWTAAASAIGFIAIALTLALVPVPFVVQAPGEPVDVLEDADGGRPVVSIAGGAHHGHTGSILALSAISSPPEGLVSLPEAAVAHWSGKRSAIPRQLLYDPASSSGATGADKAVQLAQIRESATVAGLRAAGVAVEAVAVVTSVSTAGPAFDRLKPGDVVVSVNGRLVSRPDDIYAVVAAHRVTDALSFTVLRDGKERTETVTVVAANDDSRAPSVATKFSLGYRYPGKVDIALPDTPEFPTQGLAMALGVYEEATPKDVTAGRRVTGIGTIDARGVLGPNNAAPGHIGLAELIGSAEQARADIVFVHEADCADVLATRTKLNVVKVATLSEAISVLAQGEDPQSRNEVPRCP